MEWIKTPDKKVQRKIFGMQESWIPKIQSDSLLKLLHARITLFHNICTENSIWGIAPCKLLNDIDLNGWTK